MSSTGIMVLIVLAAAAGAVGAAVWAARRRGDDAAVVAALRAELAAHQRTTVDQVAERQRDDLRHAIDALLQVSGEQLDARVRSGAATLESRKELIDAELARLGTTLEQVVELVRSLDAQRATQLGRVSEQLGQVTRGHAELASATGALRQALTASQVRGQWGERMATDVLRAAGFVEGVNYRTQLTTPSGSRPDVTFLLPGDQVLHMDVKFPLTNYLAMLEADTERDRDALRRAFLRDVRARVRELAERDYIDPAGGTLDCVLLFLPNEQVYGFVHEHDPQLLDDALERKVVICSPSTLFATLAVIRQAVDSFALERTSDEILQLLAGFAAQWERFTDAMDKVGRGLATTQRAYDALAGTRRTQLERQLDRIDELRSERGVEAVLAADATPRLVALRQDVVPSDDDELPGPAEGRSAG
jgi:DNA recombination protein RmuC